MKNLAFVFILILSFSCKNQTATNSDSSTFNQLESMQWLDLKGNKEIQKAKKIVLVSGDEEYRSEEALPMLAKILSKHHGFDCSVLFAQDPAHLGVIDPNYGRNIPGTEMLENADLMILFTRFRDLPNEQMKHFENYLQKGKPIIAIRTSTHAFNVKDSLSNYQHWGNYYDGEKTSWHGGFGKKILGANWHTHHGHHKQQSTRGQFAEGAKEHPILKNIEVKKIWGASDVYGHPLPMPAGTQTLILGQTIDRENPYDENDLFFGMKPTDNKIATSNSASKKDYNPNDPMMPIVWTKPYQISNGKKGMSLTSTIGASSDLLNDELRKLFVNATYHLLNLSVPEKVKVDFVGKYKPTQFSFHKDEYFDKKKLKISDLVD